MGSGATKINSNESSIGIEREKSGLSICSEKNNNVVAKQHSSSSSTAEQAVYSTVRPLSGQGSKNSTKSTSSSSVIQKLPDLQTRKPKESPSETKVISLTSAPLEPLKNIHGKEKDAVAKLNKELASSESQKLDLQQQIQILEEKLVSKGHQQLVSNPDSLQETLHAKDQYIMKLEREAKTNQAEANKMRIKLKKKIRTLTNQLQETRQEASINQMELKAEITRLAEQIKVLRAGGSLTSSSPDLKDSVPDQDHSKIIVELSNQLSEQAEQITSLESELSQKKKEITDLKLAISDHCDSQESTQAPESDFYSHKSLLPNTSTDRLHSSRGQRMSKQAERSHDQKSQGYSDNLDPSNSHVENRESPLSSLHRQSTALSDSDSDWGESIAPSHIHSAPPGSRVKSAVSVASSGHRKGSLTTFNGNDDSIMDMVSALPSESSRDQRESSRKKSTLRNRLEKARFESQTNSLIGPSLAFERKTDAFSDTSCEPTPRPQRHLLQTDQRVRIVKPIVH